MTLFRYVAGAAALLISLVAVVSGASALRARLVPDWTGTLSCLVVSVLSLTTVTVVSETLGTVRLFRVVPLTVALVAIGLAARLWDPTGPPAPEPVAPAARAQSTKFDAFVNWVAFIAVAVVCVEWLTATVRSYQVGMTAVDAVWYHMPTAARFAQSGSTWNLHIMDTSSLTAFYPGGSELLHAVGMAFLGTDAMSRALNLGWLALALLAAWCIGARFRAGPMALLGAAALFATPQLVGLESGQALNDMAVTALLLASVAVIVNAVDIDAGRWLAGAPLVLAAMAAGMAAGTKWTALVSVAALTVCLPFVTRRAERVRGLAVWFAVVVVTGGYWYLRNLVAAGSPVPPQRLGIGPIRFPYVEPGIPTFSITRYLTNGSIWHHQILPALRRDFGPLWWLVLLLAAAGLVAAALAGRDRGVRIGALVGAACVVSFIVTKQGFTVRLWYGTPRYAAPGLALGFVLLPVIAARITRRATGLVLALYGTALIATQFDSQLWRSWWPKSHHLPVIGSIAAIAIACALVAAVVNGKAPVARVTRVAQPMAPALLIVVALIAGVAINSYRPTFANQRTPDAAAARLLSARHVTHARIALTGDLLVSGSQYAFYDKRLTNYVQFISEFGPHRAAKPFTSCAAFLRAVSAGHYDYVVAAKPEPGAVSPGLWLRADPSAQRIDHNAGALVTVYEITGPLHPAACR